MTTTSNGRSISGGARIIASLVFVTCTSACTGYRVLRAADPNPLAGQTSVNVQPLRYVDLEVDGRTEAEHLAKKKPTYAAEFRADKSAIVQRFATTLASELESEGIKVAGGDARFTVRPWTSKIDSGHYRIPAFNAVTRLFLHVEVADAGGNVVDEILIDDGVPLGFDYDAGVRYRKTATLCAERTASYLASRMKQ